MNHRSLRIVQLNMARSRAVSDELLHYCTKENIDIALVQEPYAYRGVLHGLEHSAIRTAKSKTNEHHGIWAAIVVFNSQLDIVVKPQLTTEHSVIVGVAYPGQSPIDMVSSYFQFRRPTEYFTNEISCIHAHLLDRAILGMDVNAFSPKWHDLRRNE